MSINEILYKKSCQFSEKYGLNEDKLKDFLISTEWDNLQEPDEFIKISDKAIELTKYIMMKNEKMDICDHIGGLADFESYIRKFKPKHRDHVIHTMFTFILGIYINETYMKKSGVLVNPFQWKIACLFHDIGYPVGYPDRLLMFEKKVDEIKKDYVTNHNSLQHNFSGENGAVNSTTKIIPFKVDDESIGQLTRNQNSFELIQNYLQLNNEIDLKKEYLDFDKNKIHHGIISSLAVLSMIDLMYYTNNPSGECSSKIVITKEGKTDFNQKHFDNDIIPACSAIYIHSHKSKWFKHIKINCSKTPVAFLLRLSDCLQEWDRPSGENGDGLSSDYFEIEFNGSDLIFNVNIPNDTKKDKVIKKIEHEISCLECLSVKIL